MTTLLRPAAFIAAVMLGLFGLVAAPMSVQAEVVISTEVATESRWCHLTAAGQCQGLCILGTCKDKFETRTQTWYVNGVPYTQTYQVFVGCGCG